MPPIIIAYIVISLGAGLVVYCIDKRKGKASKQHKDAISSWRGKK